MSKQSTELIYAGLGLYVTRHAPSAELREQVAALRAALDATVQALATWPPTSWAEVMVCYGPLCSAVNALAGTDYTNDSCIGDLRTHAEHLLKAYTK